MISFVIIRWYRLKHQLPYSFKLRFRDTWFLRSCLFFYFIHKSSNKILNNYFPFFLTFFACPPSFLPVCLSVPYFLHLWHKIVQVWKFSTTFNRLFHASLWTLFLHPKPIPPEWSAYQLRVTLSIHLLSLKTLWYSWLTNPVGFLSRAYPKCVLFSLSPPPTC